MNCESRPGAAAPLTVELFSLNQDAALPPGCADLFQAGERESFDLSLDWFRLLASSALSPGIEPRPYVLKQADVAQGVLLLCAQQSLTGGRRVQSLTNFYSSLFRPLLAPSVSVETLANYLRGIQAGVDVMRFDALDSTHPTYALLASALRCTGFRIFPFFAYGNWYLPVQGRSFDAYFQQLSSQVRNTVRRREKKFFADGRGTVKIVNSAEGLQEAIAAWDKIYRESWKIAEPFPAFVPGLIHLCAARGWLRLGLAYYDGEAVAAQLWIVSHGRAAIYKLAYDEKFAQLSAGTVLTAHLMRHVLDTDKVEEIDYLIGDDGYKKDWMSHRRERWGIIAFNLRTPLGLLGALNESVRRMAKRIMASMRPWQDKIKLKWRQVTAAAQEKK